VAALTLFLTGCATIKENQRAWLNEGEQAYQAKQYPPAVDRLSRFLGEVHAGPDASRALYVRGMANALLGRRVQAYGDLQRATSGGDSDLTWRVYSVLGVMYFEDEQWPASAAAFHRAVSIMPAAPPRDALLFREGLALERAGRWSAAQDTHRRIPTEFPRSAYAGRAQRRLALRPDHFAVQAGVFSRAESAAQLIVELRGHGIEAYTRREQRDGRDYNIVLVGRFDLRRRQSGPREGASLRARRRHLALIVASVLRV